MKNKIEVEIFIHAPRFTKQHMCFASDMTEHGYILLGSETVFVDVPDANPVDAELGMLNKQVAIIEAELGAKLQVLNDRIYSLKCIEHKK